MTYDWPGNVRELKNYIEGAMNLVSGHIINKEHFTPQVQEILFKLTEQECMPIGVNADYNFCIPLDEYMENIEKNIILQALSKSKNNISEASRLLNIKRQTLQHKMKKYNINF
ncbi:helix-turn-helix domain-containing protein [Fervidicella metallireducens]|uniref:helix-turn-helix domain-containing protein n=1 Tax=Fervidicella metallireducens TaxID=655338 RepID=UPI001FA76727|nr:helix-turn-helix domain-containing protein [Fervidicella metallireducens]